MRIGHSSGIDASVGVLFATALHGKKEFCEQQTVSELYFHRLGLVSLQLEEGTR
jgi:hypothetical protein